MNTSRRLPRLLALLLPTGGFVLICCIGTALTSHSLTAVANECGSTSSGATDFYCTDVYGYCESNVLAYTIPSNNVVVNCPIWYTAIRKQNPKKSPIIRC